MKRPQFVRPSVTRSGVTIIELLVVLGIVSLLLALLLPAVQVARESARRTACGNHLRQMGIASAAFEASETRYPGGAVKTAPISKVQSNNLSPHVQLLPYLDQQALYDQFDASENGLGVRQDPPSSKVNAALLGRELAIYVCPSDASEGPRCNYRISAGTSPWLHETLPKSPTGALQGYRTLKGRKDADFPDGKSNTTAFAEKLSGDRDPGRYTPWRDLASVQAGGMGLLTPDDAVKACARPVDKDPKHFSFGGTTWALSGYPQTWYNHVLPPNARIPDCVDGGEPEGHGAFTARSLHPGGVNVLFADGSVRFIASSVDLPVWRALGTVAGNETVALD